MKTSFSVNTLVSFYCWMDNYILQKGQAYYNRTSQLFYQNDSVLDPAYVAYAAPFKSFVWDSGVSGAYIINSVSGDITLSRGQSGMKIDFENGRVLLPAVVGTGLTISGSYAFKELNIYKANETQEKTVFTNKYYLNPRFNNAATGAPPIYWDQKLMAYNYVTPCIFVTQVHTKNDEFALGGLYDTTSQITLNVFAENSSQLEGVHSLLTDAKNGYFPFLNTNVWPLDAQGDWKSGYNYQTVLDQYGQPGNLFTITDVQTSKVYDGAKIDEGIFMGIVDLQLSKVRTIR